MFVPTRLINDYNSLHVSRAYTTIARPSRTMIKATRPIRAQFLQRVTDSPSVCEKRKRKLLSDVAASSFGYIDQLYNRMTIRRYRSRSRSYGLHRATFLDSLLRFIGNRVSERISETRHETLVCTHAYAYRTHASERKFLSKSKFSPHSHRFRILLAVDVNNCFILL